MILRKSNRELERMASAGAIVARTLELLREAVAPGVTTIELDARAESFIRSHGGVPSFKGYHGFPASICTSPNDMIVHGIPGPYALQDGDILSLDVGVTLRGFVADSAITVPVGDPGPDALRLLETCRQALFDAVDVCVAGNHLSDVGHAVQAHEEPQIPNYGLPGRGPELLPGMVLAVEPMITAGSHEIVLDDDGWSIYTTDGSLASHFEHTIAVTEHGPEILTRADGWSPVDEALVA
jgi:methionyl aminopeptidase